MSSNTPLTGRLLALALLGLVLGLSGCVPFRTDETEVGVRTAVLSYDNPVQDTVYPPGGVYFFVPFLTDWHTFSTAMQNLQMVEDSSAGDREGDDSLVFKTIDGNDISVDVTVTWRIDSNQAPYLLQMVSDDLNGVRNKLVRPVARMVVRDTLNQLRSEDYYTSARFEKAQEARELLNEVLNPEGVVVEQVLLGEHRFREEYEQVIRERKVAEQEAERLRSETAASIAEWERNLELERGRVQQSIAQATGEAEQRRLLADAINFEREQEATAIGTEAETRAEGIRANNEALAGVGGRALVKLRIAEALADKRILFLPSGGGGELRVTDVNDLLGAYAATQAPSE